MVRPYVEIGNYQKFTLKNLTLELTRDSFRSDGGLGLLGYKRYIQSEFNQDAGYNVNSSVTIRGKRGPARYQFEWDLFLSAQDNQILEAIVFLQGELISTFSTSPGCLLIDQRLVLPEYATPSRQRAKYGDVDLGDPPIVVPSGFELIWPKFNILFTECQSSVFIPSLGIYNVQLKAKELNLVGS